MKTVLFLLICATSVSPLMAVVNIDYVTVGNVGNVADSYGDGAVSYIYNIGKYEVTNAQYVEFLNAKGASNDYGIYDAKMANEGITQSGSLGNFTYSATTMLANRPVGYISWFDAARFTNWLGNGQGSGDMEDGAYTLNGANSGIITVNSGATVYLPSGDEWVKAAYYNGATASYSLYPNGQNTITTADANYGNNVGSSTDVGTYADDPSYYGTFDQGGNVLEWTDEVFSGTQRLMRGGSWPYDSSGLLASARLNIDPTDTDFGIGVFGFRVASVPEPTSIVLTMLGGGLMLTRRKRW